MSTPETQTAVEHEVRIAARPDTVFPYFTDPALMTQWMGVRATLDPRPGGAFDGDGTLVRLVHRDLPEPSQAPHNHGWTHYLARLAVAGAGGDPGRDPWLGDADGD
jgi:hypothetical protein